MADISIKLNLLIIFLCFYLFTKAHAYKYWMDNILPYNADLRQLKNIITQRQKRTEIN